MVRKSVPRARLQGNLDGLCGVYSVVNATVQLSPKSLSDEQVRSLFRILCSQLANENRIVDALVDGMTVSVLKRQLRAASDFLQKEQGVRLLHKQAFRETAVGLEEFWSVIQNHVLEHGTGSALLGLGGKHDHWTCIDRITSTRITLLDSDRLHHLQRANCTTADEKKGRHHVLSPTQTFLLSTGL